MLRKFGQQIIEMLGEKRVHPNFAIPGGVNRTLSHENQEKILKQVDNAIADVQLAVGLIKDYLDQHKDEAASFAAFPSGYMGLTDDDGNLDLYDGTLRMRNERGAILEDKVDPKDYLSIIEERVEDWSYLKFPYYKKQGCPDGMYRVGPLARLNVVDRITTPLAGKEFKEFKKLSNTGIVEGSLYYHYARMIEALYAAERIKVLAEDDLICSTDLWATSGRINEEGVGVLEAPRGTLFHHYWVDKSGMIKKVNLIVATGNNNAAMNRAVLEVAKKYVKGNKLTEGMLNRVEAAIRCYDPCLSCSTHALGQMPLIVQLVSASGELLDGIKTD
jgi:NAD-reducing hydrogenase large subunit